MDDLTAAALKRIIDDHGPWALVLVVVVVGKFRGIREWSVKYGAAILEGHNSRSALNRARAALDSATARAIQNGQAKDRIPQRRVDDRRTGREPDEITVETE